MPNVGAAALQTRTPGDATRLRAGNPGDAVRLQASSQSNGAASRGDGSSQKVSRALDLFRSSREVKPPTQVGVHVAVGSRLPTSWVYVSVPEVVSNAYPAYLGYVYTYVDRRYVVCDPATYKVIAVYEDAPGTSIYKTAAEPDITGVPPCSIGLRLSSDEREVVRRSVRIGGDLEERGLTVGSIVPASVDVQAFPEPVVSRVSKLGACRYFVVKDRIAIVDPDQYKVVAFVADE